ncbi:MAG: zinc-finger domain-containing protein [Granulosicoccus sp.]|nr:zinc-finger domain-containing protein [Granulosicoccus sp.]
MNQSNSETLVSVSAADLPLHCPTPDGELWDSHPRVFIPVAESGEAKCPYCGTVYRLVDDTAKSDQAK